jgi:hypothetical protein
LKGLVTGDGSFGTRRRKLEEGPRGESSMGGILMLSNLLRSVFMLSDLLRRIERRHG